MPQPSVTHPKPGTFDLMIDTARRGHLFYSLPDDATNVGRA